jgi:hypothetical protein
MNKGATCEIHMYLQRRIAKIKITLEPGQRSRYSDWLRAGRPRGRSSSPGSVKIFSSPRHPDRLWGSPNLLSNGYRGLFPRG